MSARWSALYIRLVTPAAMRVFRSSTWELISERFWVHSSRATLRSAWIGTSASHVRELEWHWVWCNTFSARKDSGRRLISLPRNRDHLVRLSRWARDHKT